MKYCTEIDGLEYHIIPFILKLRPCGIIFGIAVYCNNSVMVPGSIPGSGEALLNFSVWNSDIRLDYRSHDMMMMMIVMMMMIISEWATMEPCLLVVEIN